MSLLSAKTSQIKLRAQPVALESFVRMLIAQPECTSHCPYI
jgi:hypothetical protein